MGKPYPHPLPQIGTGGGAVNGTFSMVQHPKTVTCATASCAVATAATTPGNLLVAWSAARYSGTGVATVASLASVTDNGTAETWTRCPQSAINDSQNSNGTIHALDCFYVLSAAGGATSVTANWTLSGLGASSIKVDVEVIEYHPSLTPIFYDSGNAFLQPNNCNPCSGPAGINTGTADVITQAIHNPTGGSSISSISGSYSNPFDNDNANNALFAGFAGAINSASYSQPSWTLASSSLNPSFYATASFGFSSTPAPTGNMLIDFSACGARVGLAPTTTCVGNSTFSGWGNKQGGLSGANPGMTIQNNVLSNLPKATIINGVSKTGNSSFNLHCVTSTTGTNCGYYEVDLGVANSDMMVNPLTVGWSFKSSCASTGQDCGAHGVRLSNSNVGGFYAVAHISPLGDGHLWLEGSNGPGIGDTGASYTANTEYRVNMIQGGIVGTTDRIKYCSADGQTVLGTSNVPSGTNINTSSGISSIQIGIAGEEPTVPGITYDWGNIVVGGVYSDTGPCF